ncbi:hypothetical protein [Amycolatopsis japonica]
MQQFLSGDGSGRPRAADIRTAAAEPPPRDNAVPSAGGPDANMRALPTQRLLQWAPERADQRLAARDGDVDLTQECVPLAAEGFAAAYGRKSNRPTEAEDVTAGRVIAEKDWQGLMDLLRALPEPWPDPTRVARTLLQEPERLAVVRLARPNQHDHVILLMHGRDPEHPAQTGVWQVDFAKVPVTQLITSQPELHALLRHASAVALLDRNGLPLNLPHATEWRTPYRAALPDPGASPAATGRPPGDADGTPPAPRTDNLDSVMATRSAIDWNTIVGDNRVILFGENHTNRSIRDFLSRQARAMRDAGITHYGIEAPPHPAFETLNAGRSVSLSGVDVGPDNSLGEGSGYEHTIRAMRAAGIAILPLDLDLSLHRAGDARDQHMADTIGRVLSQDPNAKIAALLGELHTGNSQAFVPTRAGPRLHASQYPVTSVVFKGGNDTPTALADAVRDNHATGDTFFVDLHHHHATGGELLYGNDVLIHLPQSARPGHSTEFAGFGDGSPAASVPDDARPEPRAGDPDNLVANRSPVDWNTIVGNNRVVLLGEGHTNRSVRDFLSGQARAMREAGITHYGIEAPAHPAFEELNAGRSASLSGVTVGPKGFEGYELAILAMRAEGITIVPLDLDQPVPSGGDARDRHMADTIGRVLSQDPNAKIAALLGEQHTVKSRLSWGPTRAGAILHASQYPVTSVVFKGGNVSFGMLAAAVRNKHAAGETFFADLRPHHAAGGTLLTASDALIHLPHSARPGPSPGSGSGGLGKFDTPVSRWTARSPISSAASAPDTAPAERTPPTPPRTDNVIANRSAIDWNTIIGDNRAILFGEDHDNRPVRDFLSDQARAMREAGVTHYGIEAPTHPAFDDLNAGRSASLSGVKVGPKDASGYEDTILAMRAEGITIVPLDLDQPVPVAQEARDRHMAETISRVLSQDPNAKIAALVGEQHTVKSRLPHRPVRAGAILHASQYPAISVVFKGGNDNFGMLAAAARDNHIAGEIFFADLRPYHAAGGELLSDSNAVIHLAQSARPDYPTGSGFGGSRPFILR